METTNLDAWPQQRFRIRFDWNSQMKRWKVHIRHLETDTIVADDPALLLREYRFEPHVEFVFYDPSNTAKKITPANLGRKVRLGVLPIEDE